MSIHKKVRKMMGGMGHPLKGVRLTTPTDDSVDLTIYKNDPVGFANKVLGVNLTEDQEKILKALPGRIKIESGHNVGKSFLMAVILLWWFYTRTPSVVVCNAPKLESLRDILWSEVRLLWQRAVIPLKDYFVGPKAPEMYDNPDHWAKGFTTSKGESYQGRHRDNMLFLFDEDEGIEAIFWTTTSTMYHPDGTHAWVCCCNPVTTSSQSYLESMMMDRHGGPKWELFRLSSLNHPNVTAELEGRKAPFPNAVSLGQVEQWVKDWTTPVNAEDRQPGDVEWPPLSGHFVRPGPSFKARAMGLRPTEGTDTVWSHAAFELACQSRWDAHELWRHRKRIQIGVDPAAYGDDFTVIHGRLGPLSLFHESRQGWGPDKIAGRLKEMCRDWSKWYNDLATEDRPGVKPEEVPVVIEFDGGLGIGVYSHHDEYLGWTGVNVGSRSNMRDPNGKPMYDLVRSQIWVESAKKALAGQMDISRLDQEAKDRLRIQLLTPYYELRPDGSKSVESKKDFKKRLGRSPDDADGLIISYYDQSFWAVSVVSKA